MKVLSGSLGVFVKAELFWLKRVMQHATENSEKLKKEHGSASILEMFPEKNDTNEDDEMDEPYTQDWGLSPNIKNDSDNDEVYGSAITLNRSKNKEPIRPGDVIAYHSHIFVAGDKRGLREARVLSVNANGNPILKLSNGDSLPKDTQIKRIKIMRYGKLEDHNGIFRPIGYFKLKTDLNANIVVETESQRVQNILNEKIF